jgi:hypothetical protein
VIVFIDNDIVLKLSCCVLRHEPMVVLRLSAADVRVLRTARLVFQLLAQEIIDWGKIRIGISSDRCEPDWIALWFSLLSQ